MNTHSNTASPDADEMRELELTAAHHFEPWVRGREQPMTPANLTQAAEPHLIALYFAYEVHFKTKNELMAIASKCEAPEELSILLDSFQAAHEWLKLLSGVLRGAQSRLLIGAAAAALEMEDAA